MCSEDILFSTVSWRKDPIIVEEGKNDVSGIIAIDLTNGSRNNTFQSL